MKTCLGECWRSTDSRTAGRGWEVGWGLRAGGVGGGGWYENVVRRKLETDRQPHRAGKSIQTAREYLRMRRVLAELFTLLPLPPRTLFLQLLMLQMCMLPMQRGHIYYRERQRQSETQRKKTRKKRTAGED